jgi:hypothetical protein
MKTLALIACLMVLPATAAPVTIDGIVFSDERGDFTIRAVTGAGGLADPFVVVEEVTGSEPMLVIRFLDERFGNRIGTRDPIGMALVKLVINHSGATWYGYRLEPRRTPTGPSPEGDGLSFAQGWSERPPIASTRFHAARVFDQPYDAIKLYDGRVEDNQSFSVNLVLTDIVRKPEIFLLQMPLMDIACGRPPNADGCSPRHHPASIARADYGPIVLPGPQRDGLAEQRRGRSDRATMQHARLVDWPTENPLSSVYSARSILGGKKGLAYP